MSLKSEFPYPMQFQIKISSPATTAASPFATALSFFCRYWTSEAERKGVSPWKDPLALIGIAAIFLPFIILGVAIGTGFVDVAGGR
jgi:hypothetical protein